MADQKFPYTVSYGLSHIFRVRCINIGTYHVEQKIAHGTETEPPKWQCLAISHHFDSTEALGVMHEAQMAYAIEVRAKRNLMRSMA